MRKLFPIESCGNSLLPAGQEAVTKDDINCLQSQINTNAEDIDTLDNALQQKIAEDAQEVNTGSIIADTGNISTLGVTSITATGTITADTVEADTLCGSTANVSRVNASCVQSATGTISDFNATCVSTQNINAYSGKITDVCADNITSNTATLESATINCLTAPDLTLTDLTATNGNITNLSTGAINASGRICSTDNISGGNLFASNVVNAGNSVETPRIRFTNSASVNANSIKLTPNNYGTYYIGFGYSATRQYIIWDRTNNNNVITVDGSQMLTFPLNAYLYQGSLYLDMGESRSWNFTYGIVGVRGNNNTLDITEAESLPDEQYQIKLNATNLNHDVYIKCLETYDLKSDCGCIDGFEANTLRVCEALITNEMDMQNGNIALTGNLTHSGEFTLENECGAYICSVPNEDTINISHTNQECIDFCCGTAHCCFTICGDQVVTQNLIVCEDLVVCGNTTIAGISADSITTVQADCTAQFYLPIADNNTILPHSNPVHTTPTATVSYNCTNCESTLGITNICATGNINSDSASVAHCLGACEINACTVCGNDIIGADGCFTGNLEVDCCIVGNLCGIACKVKKTEDNDTTATQNLVWVDCDNNLKETSNVQFSPACSCLIAPNIDSICVVGTCICGVCCIETPYVVGNVIDSCSTIRIKDGNNIHKVCISCDGIRFIGTDISDKLCLNADTGNICTVGSIDVGCNVNVANKLTIADISDTCISELGKGSFIIKNCCDIAVIEATDGDNNNYRHDGFLYVRNCTGNEILSADGHTGNVNVGCNITLSSSTGVITACCFCGCVSCTAQADCACQTCKINSGGNANQDNPIPVFVGCCIYLNTCPVKICGNTGKLSACSIVAKTTVLACTYVCSCCGYAGKLCLTCANGVNSDYNILLGNSGVISAACVYDTPRVARTSSIGLTFNPSTGNLSTYKISADSITVTDANATNVTATCVKGCNICANDSITATNNLNSKCIVTTCMICSCKDIRATCSVVADKCMQTCLIKACQFMGQSSGCFDAGTVCWSRNQLAFGICEGMVCWTPTARVCAIIKGVACAACKVLGTGVCTVGYGFDGNTPIDGVGLCSNCCMVEWLYNGSSLSRAWSTNAIDRHGVYRFIVQVAD